MFKNWKTTIAGLGLAVFIAIQPVFTKAGFDITKDWKELVLAAGIAAFGFVAKDHNVTGGTTVNAPNSAAVVKDAAKTNQ